MFTLRINRNGLCPLCRERITLTVRLFINFDDQRLRERQVGRQQLSQMQTAAANAIAILQDVVQGIPGGLAGGAPDAHRLTVPSAVPSRVQPNQNSTQANARANGPHARSRDNIEQQLVQVPFPWEYIQGQTQLTIEVRGNQLLMRFSRRNRR